MMGKPSTTIRHETINLSDSALRELIASCQPAKVVDAEVIEEES